MNSSKEKVIYPEINPESAPRILLKTVRFALVAFFCFDYFFLLLWLLFFCFDCFLALIVFLLIPPVQHVRILFILLFAQAWTITLHSELTICRLQIANCKTSSTELPSCKTPTGSWKLTAELLHSRIRQQENIRSTKFYRLKAMRCFLDVVHFVFPYFSFNWITVNRKEQIWYKWNTTNFIIES